MEKNNCPRCIEDYTDEKNRQKKGVKVKSACSDCGICEQCEHLSGCHKIADSKDIITECVCGSTDFIVDEALAHQAKLIDGKLEAHNNTSNEVTGIFCAECEKDYTEDLTPVLEFCW